MRLIWALRVSHVGPILHPTLVPWFQVPLDGRQLRAVFSCTVIKQDSRRRLSTFMTFSTFSPVTFASSLHSSHDYMYIIPTGSVYELEHIWMDAKNELVVALNRHSPTMYQHADRMNVRVRAPMRDSTFSSLSRPFPGAVYNLWVFLQASRVVRLDESADFAKPPAGQFTVSE
jgi:hypothetical protein